MIIGVFIKDIKTYENIHFIPIGLDSNFCGLNGVNGIGKSSILEAFDSFFNRKNWNTNLKLPKDQQAYLMPVFLIERPSITKDLQESFTIINDFLLSENLLASKDEHKNPINQFKSHLRLIKERCDLSNKYLIACGKDSNHNSTFGLFSLLFPNKYLGFNTSQIDAVYDFLKESFEYIYIPKDIDSDIFTKLETQEIQSMMGSSLAQELNHIIDDKTLRNINEKLNELLTRISKSLVNYSYRTHRGKQTNLKRNDLYKVILQAFFSIRKLYKKHGADEWLEISSLSSGEKQKAIIDVAKNLIKDHKENKEKIILAIDEPESSLHISACYEQFESIYEISKYCRQLIFTTHWYGYFPIIESGSTVSITKIKSDHQFDLVSLGNHREQIKQISTQSKGQLPFDIRLKSINDFVQCIISSITMEYPYHWIICEGSSEKVYLSYYLSDWIKNRKLRIIPVGGASEIRKIYQYLSVGFEDFKKEINGKVLLISDTDPELVEFPTIPSSDKLFCKRIINKDEKTILVDASSNQVSPATTIEDTLNGRLFIETLKTYLDEYKHLDFINTFEDVQDSPTFFSLDLKKSQKDALDIFFNERGIKYDFSTKYIDLLSSSDNKEYLVPSVIQEIRRLMQIESQRGKS